MGKNADRTALVLSSFLAVLILLFINIQVTQATPLPCTIQQALNLSDTDLLAAQPSVFTGHLTYYEPSHRMAFLQDETDSIYLQIKDTQPLIAGDRVEVIGVVDPGIKGRNIRGIHADTSPSIRRLGSGTWPAAAPTSAADVASGTVSSNWSSIEGRIKDVEVMGDRVKMTLAEQPSLPIFLPGISQERLAPHHLKGLQVKISGVPATSLISPNPPIMEHVFLLPSLEHVHIREKDRNARFEVPESLLHNLRWISDRTEEERRVMVRGVVTWSKQGEGFFLQRGLSCAWIQCNEPFLPSPGDRVQCAGIAGAYHAGGVLLSSLWRPTTESFGPVDPSQPHPDAFSSDEVHGRLSRLEGIVVQSFRNPREDIIVLSLGSVLFTAHLPLNPEQQEPAFIRSGARLAVTGIALNRPSPAIALWNDQGRIQLQLRTAADIQLLAEPPFWTSARLAWCLAGLIVIALISAAWVFALRRKVQQQEIIISRQVSKQAIHEERVRIAREWHDTFEQHFAGLTMQLDAAAAVLPDDTKSRQMLERAAQMANHSRAEARQAIWDLRASVPKAGTTFFHELEHSLRQSWSADSQPTLEFTREGDLSSVLPMRIVAHLLRIAQESVANAIKHAEASRIVVTWRETPDELQLMITDDGKGLSPGCLNSAIARGHFGLLGLRERAHKLMAVLRIESPSPGGDSGCAVILTLPRSSLQL